METLSMLCKKWWYCSVIVLDHLCSEIQKMENVWNWLFISRPNLYRANVFIHHFKMHDKPVQMTESKPKSNPTGFGRDIKQNMPEHWGWHFWGCLGRIGLLKTKLKILWDLNRRWPPCKVILHLPCTKWGHGKENGLSQSLTNMRDMAHRPWRFLRSDGISSKKTKLRALIHDVYWCQKKYMGTLGIFVQFP